MTHLKRYVLSVDVWHWMWLNYSAQSFKTTYTPTHVCSATRPSICLNEEGRRGSSAFTKLNKLINNRPNHLRRRLCKYLIHNSKQIMWQPWTARSTALASNVWELCTKHGSSERLSLSFSTLPTSDFFVSHAMTLMLLRLPDSTRCL